MPFTAPNVEHATNIGTIHAICTWDGGGTYQEDKGYRYDRTGETRGRIYSSIIEIWSKGKSFASLPPPTPCSISIWRTMHCRLCIDTDLASGKGPGVRNGQRVRKRFIASWGLKKSHICPCTPCPSPQGYRSKVESRHFAHHWSITINAKTTVHACPVHTPPSPPPSKDIIRNNIQSVVKYTRELSNSRAHTL